MAMAKLHELFETFNTHHLTSKFVAGAATGAAIAPNFMFPNYLNTHGIGVLTYSEYLKIIGGAYIVILILKMLGVGKLIHFCAKAIFRWYKIKKQRKLS
jgi:hypothetical protein